MDSDTKSKFQCKWPKCGSAFKTKGSLDTHVKCVHERIKRFQCDKCNFSSFAKCTLQRHTAAVHLKLKPFFCLFCDFRTAFKSTLKSHIRCHVNERPFKCESCSYACGSKTDLESHWAQRHSDLRPFGCKLCPYEGKTKKALRQHMKTHYPEVHRRFLCTKCSNVSLSKALLDGHMLTHSQVRNHGCEQCPLKFKSRQALVTHWKVHNGVKEFECPHCNFRSLWTSDLKQHVIDRHTDSRPFPCKVPGCKTKCSKNSVLQKHIRVVHNKQTRYQCPLCPHRCFFKSVLEIHIRTHVKEKLYKCSQCDYSSINTAGLASHLMYKHRNTSPVCCDICRVQFVSKDNLRDHMRTHSASRKFPCKLCPYRGSTKKSLLTHVTKRHKESESTKSARDVKKIQSKSLLIKSGGTDTIGDTDGVIGSMNKYYLRSQLHSKDDISDMNVNPVCKPCHVVLTRL